MSRRKRSDDVAKPMGQTPTGAAKAGRWNGVCERRPQQLPRPASRTASKEANR